MAQRNSPSRRIPGEPLAGILRTVAYQARYANRRRADVATITNKAAAAESAEAASDAGVALMAAPATMAEAMAQVSSERAHAELQQKEAAATPVAAPPELPRNDAATLQVGLDGSATWRYADRGSVPHVVATPVTAHASVATVSGRTATSVTVHVWGIAGLPLSGASVSVVALWP